MFKPELNKLFVFRVKSLNILRYINGTKTRYDALIDLFEPGRAHMHGNLYDAEDLIKVITGDGLSIDPFLNYIDEKYSILFGY